MSTKTAAASDDFFAVAVASAVHELLTPLSVISGFAQLLQERWEDGDRDDLAVMVRALARSAERMNRLVDELIAVAKTRRDFVVLDLSEVDAQGLLEVAAQPAMANGFPVQLRCPLGLSLRTDAYRVEQIVATLVDNARHHGRPPLLLTAESGPSGISITLRDDGPTIPPDRASRLFEPFSAESDNIHASHGLGLYTSRCSARALQGDLTYVPARRGGAFVLTLPRP